MKKQVDFLKKQVSSCFLKEDIGILSLTFLAICTDSLQNKDQ